MKVKPIRSSDDLRQARATLNELMMGDTTSEVKDDIEVLYALIEQYEKTHVRIDAPSPVAAIKFRMHELGLSARHLEPFIGSRARVSEILGGKRALSIDMIRSLHEGLGIPYESLISERPRHNTGDASKPTIKVLKSFGFDLAYDDLPSFVEASFPESPSLAMHRRTRTQRAAMKTDQTALLLWQAAVLQKAKKPPVMFERSCLSTQFFRQLAILSSNDTGPKQAIEKLHGIGVAVVVLPPLPGTFLDGAAMLSLAGRPIVALTLRHDRTDSFWFTLLHELAHVHLHLEDLQQGRPAFIDDIGIQTEDRREREADDLARRSLIPDTFLTQVRWSEQSTIDDIVAVASRARVHRSIVAGRWQRDHNNYRKFARMIERDALRRLLVP